jgi:cation diffusion facilitator CzcD-associated flavoprotein CzcO
MENEMDRTWPLLLKDGEVQKFFVGLATNYMKERLQHNASLIEKLIPKFGIGCRRITPGPGYLEALLMPNTTPVFGEVVEITETGVVMSGGEKVELDALICATGFDVSWHPRWKTAGREGKSLKELWKTDPMGYMGICPPEMPNYYIFMGPNSPVSHGALIPCFAKIADYILKCAWKIATEDIKSLTIKNEVVDDWNVYAQE